DDDDDVKEDEEEEEEHLALADSTALPAIDPVPLAENTEAFKTDESAATPPAPPAYHTTSRMSIPSPPLPVLSPPLPLSPPTTSPTYAEVPLGYKEVEIWWRVVSPPTHHPSEIPSPPDKYGYIRNHKKTIKIKQARTRERKSEQNPEAKPGKVKPSVKMVKSWSTKVNKTQNIPL
ncbi:hypothetical protein Tco_1040057, partial [Tanacetum coccineum]